MNYLSIILGYSINVGLPEMIIFLLAALLLGFCIHFYWSGRNAVPRVPDSRGQGDDRISEDDLSRLQFYERQEQYEENQERLEKEVLRMTQREKMLMDELEEMREEVKRLEVLAEKNEATVVDPAPSKQHMSDLVLAQQHLHESLSKEMSERLEKAYEEFNILHEQIQKMQSQLLDPNKRNFEIQELEQSYFRLTKEYDELKLKNLSLIEEYQQLVRNFADTEEKLREATFQKLQLAKKVNFLEELVADLQQVTGHHKKLEGQLRRLSEIESLLTRSK